MKGITVSKRLLSFVLAIVMLASAFPMLALPSFADDGEEEIDAPKVWTDEDYEKLYVTDADGDGESDLIFKWDAFDLASDEVVTVLKNQIEGGRDIALNVTFDGANKKLIATDAVSKGSNGTEKDVVLGNTAAENLVADSTINTQGALLSTATLDFSDIIPSHMVGDTKVLDDVTLELTLFQQNYYGYGEAETKDTLLKGAATFGPLATTRFINDCQDMTSGSGDNIKVNNSLIPIDESHGFIAHSTLGLTQKKSNGTLGYAAFHTDNAYRNGGVHVFGNYRLQTFTLGVLFDYTVAEGAIEGTYLFDYYREATAINVTSDSTCAYEAAYCSNLTSSTKTPAHNRFWFGGNLPFAYRAIRMYDVALTEAQMAQNHVAELLDYYRVDLSYYVDTTDSARAQIDLALKNLRLGETSKEEIEAIAKLIADNAAAEKVYEDLYVTDADGDGKSDLIFKWDAFDLEAGEVVTELINQIAGGRNIALNKTFKSANTTATHSDSSTASNGTEKDVVLGDTTAENLVADSTIDTKGALLTTAMLDFTNIQPTHKVGDITVLDDVTLELTMFQQNYYKAEDAEPLKSAANYGPFGTARFIHDCQDMTVNGIQNNSKTPIDASYGFIAHSTFGFTKANAGFVAFHTDNARAKRHVFGNDRLETYNVAIVFDYTVEAGATEGTFTFDYFRDMLPTDVTSGTTGAYNALYCGNITSASPAAAHNKFWFGGNLPFAYRAIRMYSVALTSEQMVQNHIAELFDYYRADPTLYLTLTDKPLNAAVDALSDLLLGETSKEEIEQIVRDCADAYYPPLYQELYVQDGLVFLWSGEGNELLNSAVALKSFKNLLGEGEITKLTGDRMSSGYYSSKDLAGYSIVDKGVLSTTDSKLHITHLIPTKEDNGQSILSDMTLEISQSYPLNYKTSLGGDWQTAKRNFDTGCIYLGPEGYYNYTKVSSGAIIYGGKYYSIYEYTPKGSTVSETVYTPTDPSSTKQPFTLYRMVNGVLIEAEDIQNMYLVEKFDEAQNKTVWVMHEDATGTFVPALTQHGHRQTTRNLPAFDAYGVGPIENWSSGINGYVDNPVKNLPNFLNAKIDEVFTATFRFDYDDAYKSASSINYALSLFRDGGNVYNKNATYSAATDYTAGGNDDSNYGFTYGLSSTMVYYGIRLYDRALTDAEIAQNHFIDLAFQFDANLKDYLELDDAARGRIHTLFADASTLDFTKESFASTLSDYIAADGFYLAEGFDALLRFDGFSGRLWDIASLRAAFTADTSLIAKLEELGAEIEIGVMVATADGNELTVSYDENGMPSASRGALRTAYLTGDAANAFKDTDVANLKSFALALVMNDPSFTLELATELSFRAYITVKNASTPYIYYVNADSELFGNDVSFTELYRVLYLSDYESLPIVKEIGGDLHDLLNAVKDELDAAKAAQSVALKVNNDLANALLLYRQCREDLPNHTADAYLALSDVVSAIVSAQLINETLFNDFVTAKTLLTEAIDAFETSVTAASNADTARLVVFNLKKTFETLAETETLYGSTDLNDTLHLATYFAPFDKYDPNATVLLNGTDIFDYRLLVDENSYYAAKSFALALYEEYGVLPLTVLSGVENVLLEGDTPYVYFKETNDDFGSWAITIDANGLTLSGGGENGAYRAANELLARIKDGEISVAENLSSATDETLAKKKFAADKFLNADGTLDTKGTEPLTVVFIGGSLTELTDTQSAAINNWRLQVSNYLKSVFPKREFTFINVGIGGTTSYAGATRFGEHVAAFNPDIVFIEFTVNDQMSGYSRLEAQTSMESMLYQCAQLETIPSVIYTHNPYATYKGSSLYNSWMKQVEYKEEWAAHYDISTTNVYDYIYREYEIAYEEGTTNDFIAFLDTYYGTKYDTESQYGWYDVHGGYKWYADAIIENLAANGAEMLRPFRLNAYLNPAQTNVIEASYNYLRHDSDRITYSNGEEDGNTDDDWKVYTKENHAGVSVYGENTLADRHWNLPGFTAGIRQITGSEGAYLEFKTTANKLVVHDQLSRVGSASNIIYVVNADGSETKLGNSSCKSSYVQPSIQSRPIDLKNPNHEEITIRIRIEENLTYYRDGSDTKFTTTYDASKHATVTPVYSTFRFGGVIEIFD